MFHRDSGGLLRRPLKRATTTAAAAAASSQATQPQQQHYHHPHQPSIEAFPPPRGHPPGLGGEGPRGQGQGLSQRLLDATSASTAPLPIPGIDPSPTTTTNSSGPFAGSSSSSSMWAGHSGALPPPPPPPNPTGHPHHHHQQQLQQAAGPLPPGPFMRDDDPMVAAGDGDGGGGACRASGDDGGGGGILFVPPDSAELSSVVPWAQLKAMAQEQQQQPRGGVLLTDGSGGGGSTGGGALMLRQQQQPGGARRGVKRPATVTPPGPIDIANGVLTAWQEGRVLKHKINAVLYSWQVWNLYTGRDVTQGLLAAIKTALWPHLDTALYRATPIRPATNATELKAAQRDLHDRLVMPMLTRGSEMAVCVVTLCGDAVQVRSSRRFEQVFMSRETLEVCIVSKGDLPQHVWARVMKDQESLDQYWAMVTRASFESNNNSKGGTAGGGGGGGAAAGEGDDAATGVLHVVDCFGVDSWEQCTVGVYASSDGLVACHWIMLKPTLNQARPPTTPTSSGASFTPPPGVSEVTEV